MADSLLIQPRRSGKATAAARNLAEFKARFYCTECRKGLHDNHPYDDYMLTDAQWRRLHSEGSRGFLCHECLTRRCTAHRLTLMLEDFLPCLCYVNRTLHQLDTSTLTHSRLAPIFQAQSDYITQNNLPALPPLPLQSE